MAILMFFAVSGLVPGVIASIIVYPAPGDLSSVEHLSACKTYSVKVKGHKGTSQSSFVYYTENYGWDSHIFAQSHRIMDFPPRTECAASFAYFSFSGGPVTVHIECQFNVHTVNIRPTPFGIKPTVTGNSITFTLDQPRKLSIEVNNRQHPLFIFADEPDQPNPDADHYFGPGVHHIGAKYAIKSNEEVYIAGGAVVEGTLLAKGDTIEIRGRGVLSGGQWTWEQFRNDNNYSLIYGTSSNSLLEGLCLVNSPGWAASMMGDNRIVKNLKIIGWNGNTDGPWCYGDHGLLADCFIFNNDDALHLFNGSHWEIRNNIVWNGPWGHAILIFSGHNFTSQEDLLIENTYVIGIQSRGDQPVVTIEHDATKKDIIFRNLNVEACGTSALIHLINEKTILSNVVFENLKVDRRMHILLHSKNNGIIDGVHFINMEMAGDTICSKEDAPLFIIGDVKNVTVNCKDTEEDDEGR
jgi:hypothetical protein